MIQYYKTVLFAFLLLVAGMACTSSEALDDSTSKVGSPAVIVGTIGGAASVETKATIRDDDGISYSSFAENDAIGFYSTGGLDLKNAKLSYSDGSFKSEAGKSDLLWKEGNATNVYAYYPYPSTSSSEDQIDIYRDATTTTTVWNDGFEDLLIANTGSVANGSLISLRFSHKYAMLLLERGVGFSNSDTDVQVHLNYKISKKAQLQRGTNGAISGPRLLKDVNDTGVDVVTANRKTIGTGDAKPTYYYVIIPLGDVYDGTSQLGSLTVQSITLCNDAGRKMTIPFPASIQLASNTKYHITIRMRNNQAIIEQEEIRRWEETDIPIKLPAGIKDITGFSKWMATYNTPDATNRDVILGKYGTKDSQGKWTFLLLSDIDLSSLGSATSVITTFADVLDGQGHTLTGLKRQGSGHVGFFGTLNGEVKNMKLQDVQMYLEGIAGNNYGGIAGKMGSTGVITNCHILGDGSFVMGAANTGGLVGLLDSGGKISNCTSSAMVSGTSESTNLLVGSGSDANVTNCVSTGTVVNKLNDK